MELIQKTVLIKLDEEEKNTFTNTIALLEKMCDAIECEECPFKSRCDENSGSQCLIYRLGDDLKYIINKCE